MQKQELKPRTEYALREKRVPGAPLQRVRLLEHLRGNKWKAQWVEPNPGLVHYVESGQIVCAWKEHRAFLKEEEARERLRKHNDECVYSEQSPVATAVYTVFESAGDEARFYRGVLSGSAEAIGRVKTRAHMDPSAHSPFAYTDRSGTLNLPFDEALDLAQKFCAAEPAAVLVSIETTESEWSRKATRPDGDYIVGLLNEYRAAWALIRQWTGHDPAIAQREARIERLERLVWDAVYALQKAGLNEQSDKLRRVLEKH